MSRSRRNLVIALVAISVAAVAGFGVLLVIHMQASPAASGRSPVLIGEAIFQSGVGPDGRAVPRTVGQGGSGMMGGGMMGGGMMSSGCASCHGVDAHGLATQQFTSPNITYANLTDARGMLMPDGTRGPSYTNAEIGKAVTTGIDPQGSRLEWPMPRWQLTTPEWDGLLAYLKTLH